MSWVTIIWAMIASACCTLALMHMLVWWWRWRDALDNLLFALSAVVRLYLRAGRMWLAWTVCGLRTLSLVLDFVFTPNLNYREMIGLLHVSFLGETVAVAEGTLVNDVTSCQG